MTCKDCNGTGVVTYRENQSPLESGVVWLKLITDDCPVCTTNGICSQCDEIWDDKTWERYWEFVTGYIDEFICPHCQHEYEIY